MLDWGWGWSEVEVVLRGVILNWVMVVLGWAGLC